MFLHTNNLNEGGCRDKCSESKKRELYEGGNPKISEVNWQAAGKVSHTNFIWQRLRK